MDFTCRLKPCKTTHSQRYADAAQLGSRYPIKTSNANFSIAGKQGNRQIMFDFDATQN